ncbi:hypothetical protein VZT92_015355 [Zoarces viviparus]|uniref:Uncharacterized protein n=1 Tax=Zoarces viviparus TaxID=48416 RepID=A0AAW1EVP9_ZOAVI
MIFLHQNNPWSGRQQRAAGCSARRRSRVHTKTPKEKKKPHAQPLEALIVQKEILSCQSHLSFPHMLVAMATPRTSVKVAEEMVGEELMNIIRSSSKREDMGDKLL